MLYFFFFFFSSRRRHTRFDCDWSSDVCSSDLGEPARRRVSAQPWLLLAFRRERVYRVIELVRKGEPDRKKGVVAPAKRPHRCVRSSPHGRQNSPGWLTAGKCLVLPDSCGAEFNTVD